MVRDQRLKPPKTSPPKRLRQHKKIGEKNGKSPIGCHLKASSVETSRAFGILDSRWSDKEYTIY